MSSKTIASLLQILDQEREALVSGNFSALEELSKIKLSLEMELQAVGASEKALGEIERSAKRNVRLFEASKRGLKAARSRMADMIEVRKGLSMYTQAGVREHVSVGSGTLEKKA